MKTESRIEDLVRMFKILPSTTQREYSIFVDGREYGPNDIDDFAQVRYGRPIRIKVKDLTNK